MFEQLFAEFKNKKIAVVGDVMLDTYWWGSTDRISPEAPVPIVALKEKESRIGGAGNVALNISSLGAKVSIHTVTGADEDSLLLDVLMKEQHIETEGMWKSTERITTNKIRIMSRSQQMLRLDKEVTEELSDDQSIRFLEKTLSLFETERPDVVIFEDYNKGVLTEKVIQGILAYCSHHNIITAVDPKKENFFAYQGVTIFKPNLKEVRDALHYPARKPDLPTLKTIHHLLDEKLNHKVSLITLSEAGVFFQEKNGEPFILPAFVRNIADVSGAGDTVIAVASLVYATTKDARLMALVANLAGGLVCENVGTVAIDGNRLLNECIQLLTDERGSGGHVDG